MDEIDYTKDKRGWDRLPDNAKRMFHLNILYQNNMDSLVPNVYNFLTAVATETWLSYLYSRIATEEQIHSLTYSSGLQQVFGPKATSMLDYVYKDDILKKRTYNEIETANKFIEKIIVNKKQDDDAKKTLLELFLRTYFLEGIKFPFSFFVTWTINKSFDNALQGFSQAIKLIAWDELTIHTTTGQNVIRILMAEDEQEFNHLKDWFTETAISMCKETVELELEWNRYLLENGTIPGYNSEIGEHFIKYWADYRLEKIDITPLYNEKKSDIIDWFNEYRNLNKTQVALQEADNTNYQKGLKNDLYKLDELDLDELLNE